MAGQINWVGVAGGAVTLVTVAVSWFAPWWQLTVGDSLVKANVSPINMNLDLFGTSFMVPLITALNIITITTLLTSAICLLVYSFNTEKPYAKTLLDFAYKKPFYVLVAFLAGLIVVVFSLQYMFGMNIPLLGSGTITLPTVYTANATIIADATGMFQLSFVLSIVAVALCIATKFYHPKTQPPPPPTDATVFPQTSDAGTVKV
ncbi:MAG: hypothetical protein NWF01_09680 [Candidatus Bathyarchaeota archaeon]|nr:hypothetical protein [Candidatus Bathyarchaeota archaeon]